MRKLLALLLSVLMLFSAVSLASAEDALTEYPREETMYLFMGMARCRPRLTRWLRAKAAGRRAPAIQLLLYETPFMMNMLTGELEPLVCDSYEVNEDNSITVKVNEKAHFNDGTPLTAHDVVYSYELGQQVRY